VRLVLVVFVVCFHCCVVLYAMHSSAEASKALKTLKPSDQTLASEKRTLKYLFITMEPKQWAATGTKLPALDWKGFRKLKATKKVALFLSFSLLEFDWLCVGTQSDYLQVEMKTLRPVAGRKRLHYVDLVRALFVPILFHFGVWQTEVDLKQFPRDDFSLFRLTSIRSASVHLLQGVNRLLWYDNKALLEEDPTAVEYEYCLFQSMAFVQYRDVYKDFVFKLRILLFLMQI